MFAVIKNTTYRIKSKMADLSNERKKREQAKTEYMELRDEIHSTNRQIRAAYNNFNFATDSDCISYYAYLIKALEMKYALLLKLAKQNKFRG